MDRRSFIKSATAGAGLLVLPSGWVKGQNAPSNKLNIGLVGTWGRGLAHFDILETQNVVALCDINDDHLTDPAKKWPKAKTYSDWRKMLEQKDLDAVMICSCDHTHAFVANWALNRNLHVYCEKPLAITVQEARTVRANWISKKAKLATQVGMQRHAYPNFNRVRELVRDGSIGTLTDVYAWGNRQIPRKGYWPAAGEPPANLHYDLWLGPAPFHPYNPEYFKGRAGANCLEWNMFWDFGVGQIGDMGSHTMDLAWNAIDATVPTAVEAKGDEYNPDVTPVACEMHCDHPANDWRPAIKVSWYQGGVMPKSPKEYVDLNKIGHGAMFKGSKGYVICDFQSRLILPFGDKSDMSYYKPRAEKDMIPDMPLFQQEWLDACKDPSKKTACDFEYSGNMIEQLLLGLVAYRVGKKIEYDGAAGKVTNSDEANALLSKKYREGWNING